MSLLAAFEWLGSTPVGQYMRRSDWGFAAVEAAHLVGLALVGGTAIILGTGALGFGLGARAPAATARGLLPLFTSSLLAMMATGTLLVASKPTRYYFSEPFRLKMLFLIVAAGAYVWLHRRLVAHGEVRPSSLSLKGAALLLLAAWLGVGLSGRLIGLL